jgi:hypothetical protein
MFSSCFCDTSHHQVDILRKELDLEAGVLKLRRLMIIRPKLPFWIPSCVWFMHAMEIETCTFISVAQSLVWQPSDGRRLYYQLERYFFLD